MNPSHYITLLDISKEIQSALLQKMNRFYWIRAEMAKLNHYRQSGHCYPQLVEKKDGQVVAEMRATIWANDYRQISGKFLSVTGEELSEGITILCYARISYHPVYGLSLQITDIDPTFTLGEMAKEKIATIQRLKAEEVWGLNKQLKLPLLPQRLAIISVDTSKGYHDFMNITGSNAWGYAFFSMLFPALLQGDKAVESILGQLAVIERVRHHFDVVLIIRGGGGDVGLNCFDNYHLARKVATFPLPVISGIGHSTNETVVEMVSHANSITPTDLAYTLLQSFHNFSVRLEELTENVLSWPEELLLQEKRHLGEVSVSLTGSAKLFLERNQASLRQLTTMLGIRPIQKVKENREKISMHYLRLGQAARQNLHNASHALLLIEQNARLMDPVNILKRGYSISRVGGKAIRTAGEVQLGDVVDITLYKGTLETIVKEKRK